MTVPLSLPCARCNGSGNWTNPRNYDDVRTCFTCDGTGKASQRSPRAMPRFRRAPAPSAEGGDFLDLDLNEPCVARDQEWSREELRAPAPPAFPAPSPRDPNDFAAELTNKLVRIIRDQVALQGADHARHTKQDLRSYIDSTAADMQRNITSAVLAEVLARAPIKVELTRSGVTLPSPEGHQHPRFPTLLRILASRQVNGYVPNVWISGPAGSGKTFAAAQAAQALGLEFHYNGALGMAHELLGFIDAAGNYHRTPFREAYEYGGVYLFDEVDGSDNSALLPLNAALANGRASFPDGAIPRHKDCVVIATANTWGLGATAEYVGRSRIDAAFLSRFAAKVQWDYDEALERSISGHPGFAQRVQRARARARKAGLKVLIDPRASIAGAALIAGGFTETEAAELTYLGGLTPDQRSTLGE